MCVYYTHTHTQTHTHTHTHTHTQEAVRFVTYGVKHIRFWVVSREASSTAEGVEGEGGGVGDWQWVTNSESARHLGKVIDSADKINISQH